MKRVFIYSDRFLRHDYGPRHPLQMRRLALTAALLEAYGVFDRPGVLWIEPEPASLDEAAQFHTPDYLRILQLADKGEEPPEAWRYGLGKGDNPIVPGMLEGALLAAGASLQGAHLVESGETGTVFNIAGGLHHAMANRASGFCYLNDAVLAITHFVRRGRRVAYVDLDAHHGDGVQAAFDESNQVLTLSLHESGASLFPGTGSVDEIGQGRGRGFSVNLPFSPGTDDETFVWGFEEIVPPLLEAFRPDVLVTQLGVGTLAVDPLAHLNLTTHGFCRMVRRLKSLNLPWLALGGGGYAIHAVARAWTLAFAVMADADLPDLLPAVCLPMLREHGLKGVWLRDRPEAAPRADEQVRAWARRTVRAVKERVFPLHGLSPTT